MKREKFTRFPFEAEDVVALMNTRHFFQPWISEYFMFTYTEIWFVSDMNGDVLLHAVYVKRLFSMVWRRQGGVFSVSALNTRKCRPTGAGGHSGSE